MPEQRVARLIVALFGGIIAASLALPVAHADSPPARCKGGVFCEVAVETGPSGGTLKESARPGGRNSKSAAKAEDAWLKKFDNQWNAYSRDFDTYQACGRASVSDPGPARACMVPQQPPSTQDGTFTPFTGGGPPLITPGQAGAIAAARLKIPTVAPGIGPSPDLNRWKMAAVGYPLWLWADGPTQVGPVSDSVAGLSVSLQAEVTSLTFRMGDGTTVTCQGVGDKWTKAIEPGAKAPSCGHTYLKPSLPKGNYKVAALTEWAVTWTANGQSGVIDVPAVQTTELPVGELQVLVR